MPDTPSGKGRRSEGAAPLVRGRDAVIIAFVIVFCGAAIKSCGASSPARTSETSAAGHTSVVATVQGDDITVYQTPSGDPWIRMSNPTPVGAERVFLVEGSNGKGWLKVLLPLRPNGSKGWIDASDVTLEKTTYRVHIYLDRHRFVVKHDEHDVALEGKIGVGTEKTPTPNGEYFIVSLLKTPGKNSAYGPYAFGLSGFSGVLKSFAGGPARIGIHGTNKPELLGQDVSHGCIRMSNAKITELAHMLPLGTPVYVHS